MTADQAKVEALAYALKQFVDVCDEAEALVGEKPLTPSEVDFQALARTMLPRRLTHRVYRGPV